MTKKERAAARRATLHGYIDTAGVYVAVTAGVLFTEVVAVIRMTGELSIRAFSWEQVLAGSLIAGVLMREFEKTKDSAKRRKNWKRRLSHAFGQGAALRSVIELLVFLYTILRGAT